MSWSRPATLSFVRGALLGICCMSASCIQVPTKKPPSEPPVVRPVVRPGSVWGRSDKFILYLPKAGDTWRSIAANFLADEELDWLVAQVNSESSPRTGWPVIVPLSAPNPTGIKPNGYQVVPILCYHRFGKVPSRMVVTAQSFEAQMRYLQENDYRVIKLSRLVEYLEGKAALPPRSVVITIDDGYASTYHEAFPILTQYGFPATAFLYTDFLGSSDALTWKQMEEMVRSGLLDFQAHSKSHLSLIARLPNESDAQYKERIDKEVRVPQQAIERHLRQRVSSFAYPYGDANTAVIDKLEEADYQVAVTVNPGGNPFFAYPFALQRYMVFGDDRLETFKTKLKTFHYENLR